MRIIFLSGLYPPTTKGGGELSTHYIAQGLAARGHYVKVITSGPSRVESHINGVHVIRLPIDLTGKPLFERWHSRRVAKEILQEILHPEQFDVIHAQDFRSALALSELHLPNAVVTARDYAQICGCTNNILANGSIAPGCTDDPWHCHRLAEVGWPRRLARFFQYQFNIGYRRQAFRTFKKHIFISRAQQEEIEHHQDLTGVTKTVIYNPVAPEYLSTPPQRGQMGNILYLGRVEMYKGVRVLLEAFKILAKRQTMVKLTIHGEGAQKQAYERLVAQWGLQYRVTFSSHTAWDRVIGIYDGADVVVTPNLWMEPFGRTVIEAMARGTLVVAADTGGPAEIIRQSNAGLLFTRGSAEDLAQKLEEALFKNHYDKRETITRGRAWVAQNLSIDAIAQQHEAFYQR